MKISKFEIGNFKGIAKTAIGLQDNVPGNIVTLIGLNESGKTTILEALSHFISEDKDTAGLVDTVAKKPELQDIIPKDRKAAFNGNISIKAHVIIEDEDVEDLIRVFKERGYVLDVNNVKKNIAIDRSYHFTDSTNDYSKTYWDASFYMKKKQQKKFRLFDGSKAKNEEKDSEDHALWLAGLACLRERLPKMVYFPTFLFNFPDRIYLEGAD